MDASARRPVKAIVLDCDGVILESNDVKAQTLRRLFGDYPEHGEAIVDLHRNHGGLPRHEKLRIICEEIVGIPVDEDGIRRLSEECGRLVDDAMMAWSVRSRSVGVSEGIFGTLPAVHCDGYAAGRDATAGGATGNGGIFRPDIRVAEVQGHDIKGRDGGERVAA